MDTTPEYVRMSEAAVEIQDYINKHVPDWQELRHEYIHWPDESYQEAVWLPRQDELQEMVVQLPIAYAGNYWGDVLRQVAAWSDMHCHGTSMEQLWLAYVMDYMYNKRWTGKDWVDESSDWLEI